LEGIFNPINYDTLAICPGSSVVIDHREPSPSGGFRGDDSPPIMHKESLKLKTVTPSRRSYE